MLGHQTPPPPHDLTLIKYGISMYRGSHIAPHEKIEAIGFDGGILNNEKYMILGGWSDVRILGAEKKVLKVDTKVLHQNSSQSTK